VRHSASRFAANRYFSVLARHRGCFSGIKETSFFRIQLGTTQENSFN
jgi:hypothetical protein